MLKLDLVRSPMEEIAEALEKGTITSAELVTHYLDRIEQNNIKGLGLRAVLQAALQAAKALDEERSNGKVRSRLHGIPIIIKDVISTDPSMGMQTTGGLIALGAAHHFDSGQMGRWAEDSQVQGNAPLVDSLTQAGIIIIGKANLTALNNYYGDIPDGWSPRGGQTVSAYVGPDYGPGGGSSGSAVGLSAGFCAAAIGCETSGSIMSPARRNGLYAFKPSGGLVSNAGIIPVSVRVDTAGPMGKSTWDVAALLDQMRTQELESCVTVVEHAHLTVDRPPRIGVPRQGFSAAGLEDPDYNYSPEQKAQNESIFASVVTALQAMVVKDPADLPDDNQLWRDSEDEPYQESLWALGPTRTLLRTEFFEGINAHLESRVGGEIKGLADLVKWNDEHPDLAGPPGSSETRDELLKAILKTGGARDASFDLALEQVQKYVQGIDGVFDREDLDVLLFPGGLGPGTAAPVVAARKQYPLATLPVGLLDTGEPVAIYLMARHGHDLTLLRCMALVEQLVGIHPIPNRL